MVNIERPYLIQGWTMGSLEHCSNLYINCTTVKLVRITNVVSSVQFQAAGLYTYNKVRY